MKKTWSAELNAGVSRVWLNPPVPDQNDNGLSVSMTPVEYFHTVPLAVIAVPVTTLAPNTAESLVTLPIVVVVITGTSTAFWLFLVGVVCR